MNGNSVNEGELPKTENSKKTGSRWIQLILSAVGIAVVAALIGGMIGYNMKPVAKTDDLVVTEDVSGPVEYKNASAEKGETVNSLKPYTQITSIMDNARHVVEERYYAADSKKGYSAISYEWDDRGNVLLESYFDENEKPIDSKSVRRISPSIVWRGTFCKKRFLGAGRLFASKRNYNRPGLYKRVVIDRYCSG